MLSKDQTWNCFEALLESQNIPEVVGTPEEVFKDFGVTKEEFDEAFEYWQQYDFEYSTSMTMGMEGYAKEDIF